MAKKLVQRIDGILKHIDAIQSEMNGVSFEEFKLQHLLPEAVSFNLAQIGERMSKLEEILKDNYPLLPWKEARRMRNIIIHDYDNANYEIIFTTAINDLSILKNDLKKIKEDISKTFNKSFETKRLILKPWNDFDAFELFELAKEPEIGYWCGWKAHEHIRDSLFALHNFLELEENYAICLKDNEEIIGSISLDFECSFIQDNNECGIGFWIGKPYWNNGYATEAAEELIKHSFENLNINKIWCGYYEGNERSKKVQEKLGFTNHQLCNNIEVPQLKTTRIGYSNNLTKEQWAQNHKQS